MMRILLLLAMLLHGAFCISMPGDYLNFRAYPEGAQLPVEAHRLSSAAWPLQSYDYYSFPFCKPEGGVKRSSRSFGEILMGQETTNSPFEFHMNRSESGILCTSKLSEEDAKHFKNLVDKGYQAYFTLDKLPVLWLAEGPVRGFPVGEIVDGQYYIFNQLNFTVLIHNVPATNGTGFAVVGFQVSPRKDVPPVQVNAGAQVSFSYKVHFEPSLIDWSSRWDAYQTEEAATIQQESTVMGAFFTLVGALVLIGSVLRVQRDHLASDERRRDIEAQVTEERKWKRLSGDVFRAPHHAKLLCIMFGSGLQILGMPVPPMALAALGFLPPVSESTMLTWMLMSYLLSGILGGFAACKLFRTIRRGKSTDWMSVALGVACFFPALAFTVLGCTSFAVTGGAMPLPSFVTLLSLWLCILVPLTLLGGHLGVKVNHIVYPVPVNPGPPTPRKVSHRKSVVVVYWLLYSLLVGTLFYYCYTDVVLIAWQSFGVHPGIDFIRLILLVLVCAHVSVTTTYNRLCYDEWRWWWRSFFTCGSMAIVPVAYTVYLATAWPAASATFYIGYASLAAFAAMLAAGSIGVFSSFFHVRLLYSCTKTA